MILGILRARDKLGVFLCSKSHQLSKDYRRTKVLFKYTVFENHRESLIQQCERCELLLHFEWTKVNRQECQKLSILVSF